MKKVISLFLVMALLTAMLAVSFSALSVSDVDDEGAPHVKSFKDGIAAFEEEEGMDPGTLPTQRIYFQMPNGKTGPAATDDVNLHHPDEIDPDTGEVIKEAYDEIVIHKGEKAPSWYNDYNVLDGKNYAGIYWWGGPAAVEGAWVGYRMEIADYDQGIYYVDVPYDPDDDSPAKNVATIIFNNGVDGGTDSSKPIYYEAAQTVDTNCQGAMEGEYDTLPDGSPDEWSFDNCIYVINPDQVSINPFSGKQTCGADWFVYYGNGCYGMYYEGCDKYTGDVNQDCCNPDHFVNGVHVGYHELGDDPTQPPETVHTHTPGEPVRENEVPATYTAPGSYDEVVYCSSCGEELSRTQKAIAQLEFETDPNKLYFDTNGTGWTMGTKNKVAFHIFGGDLASTQSWGAKKSIGTATSGLSGVFEFDPAAKLGYTFTPGVQYKIIFVRTDGANWTNQTYDLLFTVDCFGHIAYCDGTEYENPEDSSKKTLAAFWRGMDATVVGPVLQISSIGNVVGSCPEEGKTPQSIFNDFLTVVNETTGVTKYQNAYKFVVTAGNKTEQKMIDDIGTDLGLTKQDVYDAFTAAEIETAWDYTVSTLPGEVTPPHTHTPGDPVVENKNVTHDNTTYDSVVYCSECGEEISRTPVTEPIITHTPGSPAQENVKAATCTAEGSYDEVVRCTVCNEIISSTHKTIEKKAHTLTLVPEVPATETAEGTKAHYKCSVCGKLFQDAAGTTEATAQWLVIAKLDHVHTPGNAVQENVVPATCTAAGSYDEVVYCTSCGAELSRTKKVIEMTKHTLKRVNGKAPTETEDGWESHYKCTVCGKYFADPAGTREVTWDQIVKPKIGPVITGLLGDVDGSGEVDIVDVTVIQRVLAKFKPATDAINKLGDVNKSNVLESVDATLIQRWLLGLNQDMGIGKSI